MKTKLPLLTAALLLAGTAQASTVFVESNLADQNSLMSFDLSPAGKLTPKATVSTSGKGIVDSTLALGPFDSDQEIIFNRQRTLLFAVNSGSNTIAVFHVGKDGSLTAVKGSPFASHGINPVSVGIRENVLTVVNKHEDPAQAADKSNPNYTNFWVSEDGQLDWIENSTAEVANGSSPSQALIAPFGNLVFGADFLGGLVQSFESTPYGILQHRSGLVPAGSAFGSAPAPRLPLGLAANPYLPLLYVGFPTVNKIAVYDYNQRGTLRFNKAVSDSGTVVCWLKTNREGTRLYASNTADPSVTVYDIGTDPTTPKELQKIMIHSMGGAYQLELTPDGKNLVVLTQRFQATTPKGMGNELHVFSLDATTGLVNQTEAAPFVLNLPGDTRPQGVAIF
jgi:6-phosphogluconolactonase (cycloisomerase 2 family)